MSLKAKVLKASGSTSGSYDLPDDLFGGDINVPVMHQVVTAQLAEARSGTASTKTRSEVRGGGTKPWRQKGTGRARHGSIRSPIWVGGGVTFGPNGRKYTKRVNKKMRKSALRSALADKAENGRVWVLDGFDEPRTKAAAEFLQTADITGRTLVVLDPDDEGAVTVDRAFRNLDSVAFALYGAIATYDVLVADDVIFTRSALDRLSSSKTEEASS
ncbi:MAG TPA: 50S ribosomal protein L4 [Actinomycetota bacterium]|nr:50S ribosomal protein L4 [Actinomycetota bacterium]